MRVSISSLGHSVSSSGFGVPAGQKTKGARSAIPVARLLAACIISQQTAACYVRSPLFAHQP